MSEAKREGYRKMLWQLLCDEGPATARELQARLCGRDIMGIRPRLSEMAQLGEIIDTGERRGGGRRGPREIVWRIVDKEWTDAPRVTQGLLDAVLS
jgi:predicted transcriptional regulator